MRVTSNYQSRALTFSSERAQSNINQLQQQIATGKSVLKPSDDPAAAGKVIKLEQSLGQITQYERNATYAESRLSMEENSLAAMSNTLLSMRELALQANNDSIGHKDRLIILQEVDNLRDELFSLVNSKGPSGEYLFSGTEKTTPPYANDSIIHDYQGNESDQTVNIGVNDRIQIGTSARALMSIDVGDNTTDLFSTISNFQTTLNETYTTEERAAFHQSMATIIEQLDAAQTHITANRSSAGSQLARVESARENNGSVEFLLTQELENTQGLDFAEAISRLETEIQGLEAIQASYAKLSNLSLFNYL